MIAIGTVMEIEKNRALVFTMDGSVVYIKPKADLFVGQQISFRREELITGRRQLLIALPFAAIAAALLVVAAVAAGLLGLGGPPAAPAQPCAAYVALDINPSVQFSIDGNGIVLSARAMNDDGKKLLQSLDVAGISVDAAVLKAIERAKEMGYIEGNSGVVLVAGALNDENGNVTGSRPQYRAKLESILGGLNGNGGGTDVLAVYVDDSSMQGKADENGISLGRELLREFAGQRNITLADDEIRNGRISDLLEKLGDDVRKCLPDPDETETPEPTDGPEDMQTEEPTRQATEEPADTPEQTQEPTPSPTAHPTVTGVKAAAVEGGIKVSWPKATAGDGKFLYYKIVFSAGNPAPKYPEDGYAKVISDKFTLNTVVKSNSAYNGGDLGGKVKAGVTYYVSVTYVYENEIRPANAVRVKCPQPSAPPPSDSPYTVKAYASGGSIVIKWDKAPTEEGFYYYKIVLSTSDSSPRYPDNGYLYVLDYDTVSCKASPGDGYNGGDVGGELKAGVTYYISVTYVYDGYKKYGNTVKVRMPG